MQPKLLAAITNPALPPKIGAAGADAGGGVLGKIIGSLVGGIMVIGVLLCFLYVITGGLSWITAGGDKTQLESARNKITHAIVGLIILASAWAITTLVAQFLGFEKFPSLPIPTLGG